MPGTSNKKYNLMYVCPEHHRLIFVPGVEKGQHSVKHKDSIIVDGRRDSSNGTSLLYEKVSDGKSYLYFYRNGVTWEM